MIQKIIATFKILDPNKSKSFLNPSFVKNIQHTDSPVI